VPGFFVPAKFFFDVRFTPAISTGGRNTLIKPFGWCSEV